MPNNKRQKVATPDSIFANKVARYLFALSLIIAMLYFIVP